MKILYLHLKIRSMFLKESILGKTYILCHKQGLRTLFNIFFEEYLKATDKATNLIMELDEAYKERNKKRS